MIRWDYLLTPLATSCRTIRKNGDARSYLMVYVFGLRVATFHLDRP